MPLLRTYTCPHDTLPDERCPHCEAWVAADGVKVGQVLRVKFPPDFKIKDTRLRLITLESSEYKRK